MQTQAGMKALLHLADGTSVRGIGGRAHKWHAGTQQDETLKWRVEMLGGYSWSRASCWAWSVRASIIGSHIAGHRFEERWQGP